MINPTANPLPENWRELQQRDFARRERERQREIIRGFLTGGADEAVAAFFEELNDRPSQP